jgi:hypothetical protein
VRSIASPAACLPPPSGSTQASQIQALLVELNNFRRQNGLLPVAPNSNLATAGQGHSQDMSQNNFVDHIGSNGSTPLVRALLAGYNSSAVGENLGAGQENPHQLVFQDWTNSPVHLGNMLKPEVREAGVGYVYDPNDQANVDFHDGRGPVNGPFCYYWTLMVSYREGIYPIVVNDGETEVTEREVEVAIAGLAESPSTQARFGFQPQLDSLPWQTYDIGMELELPSGNGPKTIYGQFRIGSGAAVNALAANVVLTEGSLSLSVNDLSFVASRSLGKVSPAAAWVGVTGPAGWQASADRSWLLVTPSSDRITVSLQNWQTMSAGTYNGTVTVATASGLASAQLLTVRLTVINGSLGQAYLPLVAR